MATVSNATGPSNMSNASAGTRGLSAGDWIRLKRLRGAKTYLATNADIAPPMAKQVPYNKAFLIPPVVGTSKIRRPASFWTDYRASQTADYILSSKTSSGGTQLTQTKLCNCTTTTVATKIGICTKCVTPTHIRLV